MAGVALAAEPERQGLAECSWHLVSAKAYQRPFGRPEELC